MDESRVADQPARRYDREGPEAIWTEVLDAFPYGFPGRETELTIETPEFTSVCPWTGHPDFGTIRICYAPDRNCVELKSLKLYMFSYRNVGMAYEHVVNRILDDLVACCRPVWMVVEGDFNIRGGFHTVARAEYRQNG